MKVGKLNWGDLKQIIDNNKSVVGSDVRNNGVKATIIGNMTEAKGILVVDKIEKDVLPPTRDELFSI